MCGPAPEVFGVFRIYVGKPGGSLPWFLKINAVRHLRRTPRIIVEIVKFFVVWVDIAGQSPYTCKVVCMPLCWTGEAIVH